MKRKTTVYISIPITGLDEAIQRTKAAETAAKLQAQGFATVNPFDLGDRLKKQLGREPTYDEYMEYDLKALKKCQIIWMSKGWKWSAGCITEHKAALGWGIAVMYED